MFEPSNFPLKLTAHIHVLAWEFSCCMKYTNTKLGLMLYLCTCTCTTLIVTEHTCTYMYMYCFPQDSLLHISLQIHLKLERVYHLLQWHSNCIYEKLKVPPDPPYLQTLPNHASVYSPVLSLKSEPSTRGSSSRKYSNHATFTLEFIGCVWSDTRRHILENWTSGSNDFLGGGGSWMQYWVHCSTCRYMHVHTV